MCIEDVDYLLMSMWDFLDRKCVVGVFRLEVLSGKGKFGFCV